MEHCCTGICIRCNGMSNQHAQVAMWICMNLDDDDDVVASDIVK